MCYLVREKQASAAEEHGGAALPPSAQRVRPRWAGALAVALMAGVAVAALVAPASTSPLSDQKKSASVTPIASKAMSAPAATVVTTTGRGVPVIEQTSSTMDDDVPSAPNVAKAAFGHCEHGL